MLIFEARDLQKFKRLTHKSNLEMIKAWSDKVGKNTYLVKTQEMFLDIATRYTKIWYNLNLITHYCENRSFIFRNSNQWISKNWKRISKQIFFFLSRNFWSISELFLLCINQFFRPRINAKYQLFRSLHFSTFLGE